MRYGDGLSWTTKTGAGSGVCSLSYFGTDPKYGQLKFCEVQVTVPAVTQTGLIPIVNVALIPRPASAFTTQRVRVLSATELTNSNLQPVPTDVGAFREPCNFSHMAFDDPIVFPGQPGAAHLHTFIGNDGTNALSTGDSLTGSGNSTCTGGTLNQIGRAHV